MNRFLIVISFYALSIVSYCAGKENDEQPLRLGLIGLDTSHVIAFTSRLNEVDSPNHVPGARVIAAFKGGSDDIKSSRTRVEGYTKTLTEKYGVKIYDDISKLCKDVDAVLLTSLDGRPHLSQVRPVIKAKLPVFVDKPVAGSLKDAVEIFRLAREANVPCFSSSSLRWYPGVVEIANADVGQLKSVISYGPAPAEPHHPDLFWYGIHPTESLFTVMGPGCETVTRTSTDDTIVVTGIWKDGKVGTLHGIASGRTGYKVTAFGTKAIAEQKSGGDYTPMLREIIKFFRTGKPPVSPDITLEIYAFMEAADESKRRGGLPVKISEVLKKAGLN
ncbi:Gfo/Idh/MocA family oxidoreductase [Verrucomicrobiales bacterium]|jgi:predicted dehydrogenase|nr:Gfo/Idh/MocA family oxidoreductase [Verrucomicrobiales bacterium]MDC0049885.1 Gfo/Idh/MocA family oxidoreductase [Verrucomicrobiota bacterium]|tara:strand:+ start:355 stop:1350 length:996 start_codon:yes stop_codon:yes gene_type:complete